MRNDAVYLRDILEAIERVERYASRGREVFEADELVQTWIVHHIQIIGEATTKLSQSLRSRHQQVPWAQIAAMRNILVHAYFRIDLDEVWSVVQNDIPNLKRQIETILRELE
jgi:uncharacterized protein with HEPN domain